MAMITTDYLNQVKKDRKRCPCLKCTIGYCFLKKMFFLKNNKVVSGCQVCNFPYLNCDACRGVSK